MHRRALTLALGLATTAAAVLPSTAFAAAPSASGAQVQATLTLSHHAGAKASVVRYAKKHGLRVVGDGPGYLIVQGRDRTAAAAFGTVPDGDPRVPAALRSSVRSVAGLGTRPLFRPALSYTGTDLRSAYDLGLGSGGAGITVATIQFSGWNPSDATTYAGWAGIPVAPGQITTVPVGTASATTPDGNGGDIEVALDVEAILAVAPQAKQRVYVTENSTAGAVAAYQQIAADARAGLVQVASESWGSCERQTGSYSMNAMASALGDVVNAGVTVFASTGDSGPYACYSGTSVDTSRPDVNFPASMPTVVAVGGTSLTGGAGAWSETAWGESGGGQSAVYGRPSYQSALPVPGMNRLLPDVSADADAHTGLRIYSTGTGWVSAGGTSLAAPVWAASLGVALSSAGRTTGVGDIHQALYSNPSAFRDVTFGTSALFAAGAGYDEVTGLGSPLWSRLAPAVLGSGSTVTPPLSAPLPSSGDATPTGTSPTPTSPQPRSTSNACPAAQVPVDSFLDVPAGDSHGPDIACVAWWGIANGTTSTTYSPTKTVTRGQMAAFVARLIQLTGGSLPSMAPGRFGDVTASTPFATQIDALAAAGIVQGSSDGNFHPSAGVTRGQMATFLAKAYGYRVGQPLPAGTTTLSDVLGDAHASDIAAIVAAGLAGGYTDGTYRPTVPVSREQMATFVARLVDLLVSDGFGSLPAG